MCTVLNVLGGDVYRIDMICVKHGPGTSQSVRLDLQSLTKRTYKMTRIKSVLFAVLLLSSFTIAYAKSYELEFQTSMKAGKVQLKAGKYTLVLRGNNAVFIDARRESYTTPVKVESGTKKFKATGVDSAADQI